MQRTPPWRYVAVFALLLIVARLRTALVEVLDTDETLFHIVAERMLAGERLYDGVLDLKPPGVFAFYAAVQWLFGKGLYAVHHVTTLVVAGTAAFVALAARRAAGGWAAGSWAAALYLLFHGVGDAGGGSATSTEQLAALPIAAAMAVLLGGRSERRALLAGLLIGVAVLFKPQAGSAGAAAALILATGAEPLPRALLTLVIGAFAPLLATYGIFAAYGLAGEMVRWSFSEGVAYASNSAAPWGRELPQLLAFLALHAAPLLAAGYWLTRVRPLPPERRLVAAWLALALLATAAGGRFYWNYFVLLSVPIAVAAGAGASLLWPRLSLPWRALAALMLAGPTLASQLWLWHQQSEGRGSMRAGHRALAAAARHELDHGGGPLLALGSAAPIHYATHTTGMTPFLISDYVFGFVHPTMLADPRSLAERALPERMAELTAALGRARVVVDAPFSAWRGHPFERIAPVGALLRRDFRVAFEGERGKVFVRR